MTQSVAANDKNSDAEFRALMTKPKYAWPTLTLAVLIIVGSLSASYLALTGSLSLFAALCVNTVCSYIAYTVLHEASHGLVSSNRHLNDWLGRIGMLMVVPAPFFRAYRFLHVTHHRFANDHEKDPDYFCGSGPVWQLPFRWIIMDLAYVETYFRKGNYSNRPTGEKIGFWIAMAFAAALFTTVFVKGWVVEFLFLYFIPTRIAIFCLAITFDYLPHFPHTATATENKYRATNNRVGKEWLFSPLFIGHNYHLTHHLYPNAPFYRYRKVWLSRQDKLMDKNPAIVRDYGLRPEAEAVSN